MLLGNVLVICIDCICDRYTIEVANFDFAQASDMEYMTFSQRLRLALNNAFIRTHEYVDDSNVWSPSRKYGSMQ